MSCPIILRQTFCPIFFDSRGEFCTFLVVSPHYCVHRVARVVASFVVFVLCFLTRFHALVLFVCLHLVVVRPCFFCFISFRTLPLLLRFRSCPDVCCLSLHRWLWQACAKTKPHRNVPHFVVFALIRSLTLLLIVPLI